MTGSGRAEELKNQQNWEKSPSVLEIQVNKYVGDKMEKGEAGI